MVKARVLPAILVLLATVFVSGAMTVAVYARGLTFTLGPLGAVSHVPATGVMVLLVWAVLVKGKGLSRRQSGLDFGLRDLLVSGASASFTALWLVGFLALVGALSGHPLERSANPFAPVRLLVALLSFVGSSALQQLTLQSLALATSPRGERSTLGVLVTTAVFTLAHARVTTAPLYLVNVSLFGLVCACLFAVRNPPSYALPLGLHAGWNWAQVALLGAPYGGEDNPIALFSWPKLSPKLLGGENGFDEGLLFCVALLPLFVVARLVSRRALGGRPSVDSEADRPASL